MVMSTEKFACVLLLEVGNFEANNTNLKAQDCVNIMVLQYSFKCWEITILSKHVDKSHCEECQKVDLKKNAGFVWHSSYLPEIL